MRTITTTQHAELASSSGDCPSWRGERECFPVSNPASCRDVDVREDGRTVGVSSGGHDVNTRCPHWSRRTFSFWLFLSSPPACVSFESPVLLFVNVNTTDVWCDYRTENSIFIHSSTSTGTSIVARVRESLLRSPRGDQEGRSGRRPLTLLLSNTTQRRAHPTRHQTWNKHNCIGACISAYLS